MSWVKLDDQAWGHPKWKRVKARSYAAMTLHVFALSYCGCYLTDGFVPGELVAEVIPEPDEREQALTALVDVDPTSGSPMWYRREGGFEIHGYLDLNPSKAQVQRERKRRSQAGRAGAKSRWERR